MDTGTAGVKSEQDVGDDADTPVVGRSPVHLPRSFSDVAGLHRRNSYAGSLEDVLLGAVPPPSECSEHRHRQLRRTLAVADWLAHVHIDDDDDSSVNSLCGDMKVKVDKTLADDSCVSRWSSADHGFISGLMTSSAELDASRLALTATTATNRASSVFPASSGIADDDEAFVGHHQLDLSTVQQSHMLDEFQLVSGPCVRRRRMSEASSVGEDQRRRWRSRRRRYSLSLASSAVSSEYDYRESLVSKGFSVDLGEDLDGIMTPLSTKQGAGVTVAGMESLHQALRQIQRDVDEMNWKFDVLRSSSAVDSAHSPAWLPPTVKSPAGTAAKFPSGETSEQEVDEDLSSDRQPQSDYIWDYQSDLVPEGTGHRFVALRPIMPSSSSNFVLHRANLPRDYSDLGTEASMGCTTDDGMVDLYIDDDFGGGTDDAVCDGNMPEQFEAESQMWLSDVFPNGSLEASSSPGSVHTNCHLNQVHSCNSSDCNRCSCCCHPSSCGHSDSCCLPVKQHCPSHCDVSPVQTRTSSIPNHSRCHQHHHPRLVRHTRPCSDGHSSYRCGHGDSYGHHCFYSAATRSLQHSHVEEMDCCNNVAPECETARSSTPADLLPPFDHCNNICGHSSTSSIAGRSTVQTRPVGDKQNIREVINKTFSGCTELQQVFWLYYYYSYY